MSSMQVKNKQLWSDEELFGLLQNDSQHAFKLIYQKYASALYAAAYNLFKDKPLCEDLVQELFADLWIKRKKLHIRSLKAYLFKSIRNNVLMIIRAGKVSCSEDVLENLISVYNADRRLAEKELQNALDSGVNALPDKCREIFVLSRNEQLNNREIARQLNISVKTVENQMTIALRRLRSVVGKFLC